MRRFALLCSLAVSGLVLVPAAQAGYTVGISDQLAKTFSNPLYAPLKLKVARYIAPYDVMSEPDQLARLNDWMIGARAQHQKVLVAFEHSRVVGQEGKMPSVSAYKKAIKKFKAAYPDVKDISAWNEVNVCQKNGATEGQPTKICKNPKVAAQMYMAARQVFPKAHIVALDILDGAKVAGAVKYVKTFKKFAKPAPKIWGIHNYSDTNRLDGGKRTAELLKATAKGDVWLTETGGQVFSRSFAYDETRAAKALGCMFKLAKSNARIKRLYIYQFNGAPRSASFDGGLVGDDGVTKRPGYNVVLKRKAGSCRK